MWVNYGKIFNDLFIAHLLLSVVVKEFWRSFRIRQSYGKKSSGTFFLDTVCNGYVFVCHKLKVFKLCVSGHLQNVNLLLFDIIV